MKKQKYNIFVKVFRVIWGIWGVFWFALTVLLFAPVHMILAPIFGEKAARFLMWLTYRVGAYFILIPPLTFIKNHGRDKISKDLKAVVIGNHTSNMDFYVNPHTAPMYIRVLVKKELEKIPLFGSVMKAIAISVDRGDKASRKESMRKLKEKLDKGYSIFIYPEGTRNRTDKLLNDFKSGAFRMAIEMQLPLVVTTTANTRLINDLRHGIFDMRPGILHVYWDGPIETKGMTLEDVPALMEKARLIMEGHLKRHLPV